MSIEFNPLQANLTQLYSTEPVRTAVEQFPRTEEGSFADILGEAFATTAATDAIDKNNSFNLLTGESDDLSGMLVDMQKAELSLQLTLQIRNLLIDAYNEVMRMSV